MSKTNASTVASSNWALIGSITAEAAAMLIILGFFLPWRPCMFSADLDASWLIALHVFFAKGMRFGQDIVFTYGPWGFLIRGYHPQTYAYSLAANLCISLTFFGTLWYEGRQYLSNPWMRFLWISGISIFLPFSECFLYVIPLLLIPAHFLNDDYLKAPVLLALTIATAFVSLVKFSYMILAIWIIFCLGLDEIISRRRPPLLLTIYGFSLLVFWWLAGQPLSNLWPYLVNSFYIARDYSEAMSTCLGPKSDLVWAGAAGVMLIVALIGGTWRRHKYFKLLPVAAATGSLFLIFKASFVRHDHHALIMLCLLLPLALIFIPALWTKHKSLPWKFFLVFMLLFISGAFWHGWQTWCKQRLIPEFLVQRGATFVKNLDAAIQLIGEKEHLYKEYINTKEIIREQYPVPELEGATDCYPVAVGVIVAHDFSYRPRPVFQSYSAYSETLAMMNSKHLTEKMSPKNVLFDISPIDNRFPALEDGLSWLELLTRYSIRKDTGDFLLLVRDSRPRSFRLTPAAKLRVQIGEMFLVPPIQEGPVWACIDISTSWIYKVVNFFFKAPEVFIEVKTRNDFQQRFRLIPPMARTGFLISPLVDQRLRFAALYAPNWKNALKGMEITKARILISGTLWSFFSGLFKEQVSVKLFSIDYQVRDISKINEPDLKTLLKRILGCSILSEFEPIKTTFPATVGRLGSKLVLYAHTYSRFSLPARSYWKTKLKFTFGIADGAWQGDRPTDGVEFRVLADYADSATKRLWSCFLDPLNQSSQRVDQTVEIQLGTERPKRLIFETLPGGNMDCDWSYWTNFEFKGDSFH